MSWNWQLPNWPHYSWDADLLSRAERLFAEGSGLVAGVLQHADQSDQESITIELMSIEAVDTSSIEGENLDRHSVQASIKRILGLSAERSRALPAEHGVAEMMVDLYRNPADTLSEQRLCHWHRLLMNGRSDLDCIGAYRQHSEPMQIVSGPDYAPNVHFEAPPSSTVPPEMASYLAWLAETAPTGSNPLPPVTRAGIAHLWFESIHPFEDGNGRIGRAIAEKILQAGVQAPQITILAKTLLKHRKEYYRQLGQASRSLDMTDWLLWFATIVIEAQRSTVVQVNFVLEKTKLLDKLRGQLNKRQEKVVLRLFREGPEGFIGGLSAANYRSITGATLATTTRDLQDLVSKGALTRQGEKKATRYFLAITVQPVATVTLDEIS